MRGGRLSIITTRFIWAGASPLVAYDIASLGKLSWRPHGYALALAESAGRRAEQRFLRRP